MNDRETAGQITRCLQSARREREAPAPTRDRPVPPVSWPARKLFLPRWKRHRVYAYLRQLQRAETTKAPRSPGPLMVCRYDRLLERGVDGAELGAQTGTDAVHCTDDRERDAGCNQAVFNGGRAGLILHETRDKVLHI